MSTRNFVPRANNEGGIGTETKQWGSVWSKNMYVDGTNVKNKLATLEQDLETLNTASATKATTFNSVALMKEAPLEPGMVAMTTGYHTPNDGGSGVYNIRAAVSGETYDDGSLILLDNGNVAELIHKNTVNVKQFGAYGNGTNTDDTAFQNIATYASAKNLIMLVPPATYKVTATITGTFGTFGDVTITGGGTVDIVNLKDVADDAQDSADAAATSADAADASALLSKKWANYTGGVVADGEYSAKKYATDSATYATDAANSDASATATAAALTNYLATKETLTAPAVDPTLTISGAGADAKIVGSVAKGLYEHSPYDILSPLNKTNNSNFTWHGDGSCTVVINDEAFYIYNIFQKENGFPLNVKPGGKYLLRVTPSASKVSFQVYKRINNSWTSVASTKSTTAFTLPSDSQGVLIRLSVSGAVNETVKPEMYSLEGAMLKGALCNIGGYEELMGELGYTNANNIDKNCIITCFEGHSLTNVPYEIGWLQTILQDSDKTNFKFQIMYPMFPKNKIMYRVYRFGTTWDDWKAISDFENKGIINLDSCDDVYDNGIIFVTKPDESTSIIDFPLNSPGWLQTFSNPGDNQWRFQIAYPWATNGKILYRAYNYSGWTDWKEMGTGGGGGDITNNYITNHYESTYTINANPSITADTNNYLPSTGDTTDRKADIQAMLSSTGTCRLGAGDFYVSGINVPTGAMLKGCGNATKIHLLDSIIDGFTVKLNENSTLKDVMLIGSNSSIALSETVGTRHGVLWEGNANGDNDSIPYRGTISNVFIKGFNGGGITCYNTGLSSASGLNVDSVHITNCNAGINISYWSEFSRFTNVNVTYCYYGCINNGGNNMFVNCNFSKNKMGMLMDNSQGQSPNNTHGSAIACVFNHTDDNTGIGIKILNTVNGFIFDGCQIFFSQIYLEDTSGIVVSNSNFGVNNCNITIKNGGAVLFNGNMHQGQPTISITNNNKVHFANCYVKTSGAVVSA